MNIHVNVGDCLYAETISLITKNFQLKKPKRLNGVKFRQFNSRGYTAEIVKSLPTDKIKKIKKINIFTAQEDSLEGKTFWGGFKGKRPKMKHGTSESRSNTHSNQEIKLTEESYVQIIETWKKDIFEGEPFIPINASSCIEILENS